jgi:hypothetical protein
VVIKIRDGSDSNASVNAWIRDGSTVAAGFGGAQTLAARIHALSDAEIPSLHVCYRASEDPRPEPSLISKCDKAGMFVFNTDLAAYCMLQIPSIKSDVLIPTGPGHDILINPLDSRVAALTAALQGTFCNPFGNLILSLDSCYQQWRP